MKRRKWLITLLGLCVCLMCAIGFSACGKNKTAGKFSAAKVSQIELGMSKKEVGDILGTPDAVDITGYTYYWYEDKAKNLFAEIEKAEEEWLESGDFGAFEDGYDNLEKLYMQLEEMTYNFVMVAFSYDEEVAGVFLDKEHKYDELSDFVSKTEKVVKTVRLDLESVDAVSLKTYTFNGETTTTEEMPYISTQPDSVIYSAEFKDGSYIKGTTTPQVVGFTDDKAQAIYEWTDMLATYNTQVAVNLQGEKYSLVVAEGVTSISRGDITNNIVEPYRLKIEFVSLPSTLVEIGQETFYNFSNLTDVEIPDSVTSIGGGAFSGCSSLMEIEIPDSVTSIGSSAFKGCSSLMEIVIPDSVTSIGSYAFYDCSSLTEIVIPDSVTSIGYSAFKGCSSLTEIIIPDSVMSIDSYAFEDCDRLIIYCERTSKLSGWGGFWEPWNGGCPVVWDCHNNEVADDGYIYTMVDGLRYSIKDGVATVVSQSINITVANISETVTYKDTVYSVTSIGDWAFCNCSSLTEIIISESVTSIGGAAFRYCDSLTEIVIPDSVTSIGASAFYSCSSLTEIVIPDGVTSIGSWAFYNCSSLQYTVRGGLKYLGNEKNPYVYLADTETTDITVATIENSCKCIGGYAFSSCSSLTEIVIPDGVTSIGNYAFKDCDSLTIYCESTSEPSGWDSDWEPWDGGCPVVWDCKNNDVATDGYVYTMVDGLRYGIKDGVATVVSQSINITVANISETVTYKDTTYFVTSIGGYAFFNCDSLTEVVIPDGVKSIGKYAFSCCSSLTEIVIPDGVTSIGAHAFYGCDSLTEIVIPNSVTIIGYGAFELCGSLTEIVIPDNVTSIGNCVFEDCTNLTIYCEAESKPSGWSSDWNYSNCPVVWGCVPEE